MNIKEILQLMQQDAIEAKALFDRLVEEQNLDARKIAFTFLQDTGRWSEDAIECEMEDW